VLTRHQFPSAPLMRFRWAAPCLLLFGTVPLLAAPADQIRARIAGYRQLGAAFKAVNDGLRATNPSFAQLRASTRQVRSAAARQFSWFPAGSGPRPGAKTAAKSEIWGRGAQFRQLQNAFVARADALQRAVDGGDAAAARSAARSLGATCKSCHDQFRADAD
jgi:cytochrome c556